MTTPKYRDAGQKTGAETGVGWMTRASGEPRAGWVSAPAIWTSLLRHALSCQRLSASSIAPSLLSKFTRRMLPSVQALRLIALTLFQAGAAVCAEPGAPTGPRDADDAQPLQGIWMGTGTYGEPDQAAGVTVTITGHTLHFQGLKTNDWYEATFTLPAGTTPAQLHAQITASPDKGAIRKQVFAVFKLEAGWLTLAEVEAGALKSTKDEGKDPPLSTFGVGKLDLFGPSASDRWKALEPGMRFRAKLRKDQPPARLDPPLNVK